MPLVKAQCTNCNAMLEVDSLKDAAICPHCGTPYIVEKAIQQFNINNTNYIQNATVESEYEKLKKAAEGFLKLGDYEKAQITYHKMSEEYPQEFDGWWGEVYVKIKRGFGGDESTYNYVANSKSLKYAKQLATPEQLEMIEKYLAESGIQTQKKH